MGETGLDVHPPHNPIHSWKDFFLHLVTITIGLFIALTLEAAVEAVHHRHLVRDASANLRREIADNRKQFVANVRQLQINRDQLAKDLDLLRELRSGGKLPAHGLSWGWQWDSYADTAWKTARDMGALAYMDPELVDRFASVYGQQEYVNSAAIAVLTEEATTAAPLRAAGMDTSKLLPSEIEILLLKTAETDMRLATLQSTMQSLDVLYSKTLTE